MDHLQLYKTNKSVDMRSFGHRLETKGYFGVIRNVFRDSRPNSNCKMALPRVVPALTIHNVINYSEQRRMCE